MTFFDSKGHGDFTPLQQWQREYKLFHQLLKIPFFSRYQTWKSFVYWRKSVLHTKIANAKKALVKNLFILDPILGSALLKIKKESVNIMLHHRLIRVQNGKSYQLNEFIQEQTEYVNTIISSALRKWESGIRLIAESAGVQCLHEKGFYVDWTMPQSVAEELGPDDEEIKSVQERVITPFAQVKPPQRRLTFTEQAARRAECRRLQRFIKLTDYITVQSLHVLTVESTSDFLKLVFNGCKDSDVLSTNIAVTSGPEKETEQQTDSSTANSGLNFANIVFGTKVGTTELTKFGFDGFPYILSRIAKETVFKMDLIEVEEEKFSLEAPDMMEIDFVEPKKDSKKQNQVAQKAHNDKPLFRTELLLDVDASRVLFFAPSLEEYLSLVDTLFKLYLSAVESVPVLTNTISYLKPENQSGDTDVRGLEEGEFGDGPQISSIITEGLYFREVCGRIRGTFLGIFSNATKWMMSLENVRNMWIENEKFNCLRQLEESAGHIAIVIVNANGQQVEGGIAATLALYAAEHPEGPEEVNSNGETTVRLNMEGNQFSLLRISSTIKCRADNTFYSPLVAFFESSLNNFASQLAAMNGIPLAESISNLLVQTENLKNVLLPSPRKCFDDVSKILPGLARDKNELLLSEVQSWVRILQSPPQSVESFVEYLGWLETGLHILIPVKLSIHLVEHFYDEVIKLNAIMDAYKIPIQPTDLALFQTLGPTLRQLKESVDMASDTKEDNIQKFSLELEKALSDLMAEVAEIRNKAQDPMVLNPGAKAELVLKFLDDLRAQLDKLEASKAKFATWDELFKNGGSNAEKAEKKEGDKSATKPGLDMKMEELEETKTELQLKRILWKSLSDWDGLTR